MKDQIQIVDLFAGPGGLGEGFSAFSPSDESGRADRPFRICVSAEMDPVAHQTLRLRAFYRQFSTRSDVPDAYYDYLAGKLEKERFENLPEFSDQWERASDEAKCLTLGNPDDDRVLDRYLETHLKSDVPWVLIGGPPCQAYSLVGRARNMGIKDYAAETDKRHYLYREYLRIIRKFRPGIFVMENVKGILSSRVDGDLIFQRILDDLMQPSEGSDHPSRHLPCGYRLYSLQSGAHLSRDADNPELHPANFVIAAEKYGVPQRRHRVFVVGVREDIDASAVSVMLEPHSGAPPTVRQVIDDLTPLRSGLSSKDQSNTLADTYENWRSCLDEGGQALRDSGVCKPANTTRRGIWELTAR